MQYLLALKSTAHKAEVFHYDVLNLTKINLLDIFADHVQIVNKSRHITAISCLYEGDFNGRTSHGCIIWGLLHYVVRILNIYSVSFGDIYFLHYVVTSLNIYFLDYDLLRIIID